MLNAAASAARPATTVGASVAAYCCRRGFASTAPAAASVGFIGLGNMGVNMAANLQKAGHELVVCDLSPDPVAHMVGLGATDGGSPAGVAAAVDTVVTMLPESHHVEGVYRGPDGIFANAKADATFIDASTISPISAQALAAEAAEAGFTLMDTPVSGGTMGAEQGTLTFMVGGPDDGLERVRPLLDIMGANIVHCGDAGFGQIAKVCNNLVLGITMAGVAEAMNLGTTLGMDGATLASVINTSSGRCWASDTYNPCPGVMEGVPASRGFTGGFGSDLMLKDLGLAVEAARQTKQPMAVGGTAEAMYRLMSANGYGAKDFSVVWEFLQKK